MLVGYLSLRDGCVCSRTLMSGSKRKNRQEGGEVFKELQTQIGIVLH